MNREDFLTRLRDSRLLPDEEAGRIAERPGEESPEALCDALVAAGVLTRFQVRMLRAGQGARLVLGQYRLLDELGRGGMGRVYKAGHSVMGRTVALKVLDAGPEQQALAKGWFEREVRTLTRLQHPNIVAAYDANEVDGVRFLVMEYVEGPNLYQLVKNKGPLAIPYACEMMYQAALALQYAHGLGMVHRDIKPANLLVPAVTGPAATAPDVGSQPGASSGEEDLRTPRPLVKIVDFGLARLHATSSLDTIVLAGEGHFAGTPDYASPEQARNVHAVDGRSDLYSLGCTFYFALTGRPPFAGASVTEKLANHLMEPPPPLTGRCPDAPAGLSEVLLRLMAKDPSDRFATPRALAHALGPWRQTVAPPPRAVLTETLCRLHAATPGTAVIPLTAAEAQDAALRAGAPGAGGDGGRPEAADDEKAITDYRSEIAIQAAVERLARRAHATNGLANEQPGGPAGAGTTDDGGAGWPLADAWRRWTDLVNSVCEGNGHGTWDKDSYRRLHEALLAGCRREAATAPAARRAWYARLEALSGPWVSLQSLEATEPELLRSLLNQCREADPTIQVGPPRQTVAGWLRTCVVPAIVVWLLVQAAAAGWRLWAAGAARWDVHGMVAALQVDSLPGQAYVVLPVIVLAAVLLMKPR